MKTDDLIPTLEHEMNQTVVLDFIEARKKAYALAAEAQQQMQAQFQDLLRQAIAIERRAAEKHGNRAAIEEITEKLKAFGAVLED